MRRLLLALSTIVAACSCGNDERSYTWFEPLHLEGNWFANVDLTIVVDGQEQEDHIYKGTPIWVDREAVALDYYSALMVAYPDHYEAHYLRKSVGIFGVIYHDKWDNYADAIQANIRVARSTLLAGGGPPIPVVLYIYDFDNIQVDDGEPGAAATQQAQAQTADLATPQWSDNFRDLALQDPLGLVRKAEAK